MMEKRSGSTIFNSKMEWECKSKGVLAIQK